MIPLFDSEGKQTGWYILVSPGFFITVDLDMIPADISLQGLHKGREIATDSFIIEYAELFEWSISDLTEEEIANLPTFTKSDLDELI